METERIATRLIPTTKANTFIKVETYYSKGGINAWTHRDEPRGYYTMVTPVEREGGCETVTAWSGVKGITVPCNRKSKAGAEKAVKLSEQFVATCLDDILKKSGLELQK